MRRRSYEVVFGLCRRRVRIIEEAGQLFVQESAQTFAEIVLVPECLWFSRQEPCSRATERFGESGEAPVGDDGAGLVSLDGSSCNEQPVSELLLREAGLFSGLGDPVADFSTRSRFVGLSPRSLVGMCFQGGDDDPDPVTACI